MASAVMLGACRDALVPMLQGNGTAQVKPASRADASGAREPGMGGLFFMPASGDAVTPVDLRGTGITIPIGTQVQVEITGSITRAQTAGLQQFCELPTIKPNCTTAWANILRPTSFTASGDGSFQAGAAKAMVAWEGDDPTTPDSGTTSALRGRAGGELWAGRSGYQCWYVDNYTRLQGACFSFGGGYAVTVVSQPTTRGGGGAAGAPDAELALVIRSSTVGATGGSASLALEVTTTPDTAEAPPMGFSRWYFLPDAIREEKGTPVPSPFTTRVSYGVGEMPREPVRLDAERVRLPDGRIVGTGVHVTSAGDLRASAAGGGARLTRSSGATTSSSTYYADCDGASECHVRFGAPAGTFLVSTTLGGIPVSASVRVGAVEAEIGSKLRIVRVAGPNPDGSFTTRESRISLEASAAPGYAGTVGWEIIDDPGDHVDSPEVVAGTGAKTIADVKHPLDGRERWPGHPGRLDQKAFRYLVRAYASYGGQRVYSETTVLTQSEVDVIRQEYIDYGTRTSLTPAVAAFTRGLPRFRGIYQNSPSSETGLGDYCVTGGGSCTTLVSDRLSPFLTWLGTEWKHQPLVATSILRNPVHHHTHMKTRQTNDSPHKYGTAIDYDVTGENHSRQQKLHWTALRNTGLYYPQGEVCAETWYLKDKWAGDHVHFDRRYSSQTPCTDAWKMPEDVMSQYSASALSAPGADTLLTMLASTEFEARLAAVSALSQMPKADLPAGYAGAALEQLDIEINRRSAGAAAENDEYGAYLLELARLVHRSDDPAAAPSLARLGIEVSLGTRRFVARYAAQTIPALEEVWASEESMHADIVGTYGEMLRFQADSGWLLAPDLAATVDRAFIRAAAEGVIAQWGVAFHAGKLRLMEYAPLVSYLASLPRSIDDPFGLVATAAVEGAGKLQVLLGSADARTVMRLALRLQESLCSGPSRQRVGQCSALSAELQNTARGLDRGSHTAARHALETYIQLLRRATEREVFSAPEHALLNGNAVALLGKLK